MELNVEVDETLWDPMDMGQTGRLSIIVLREMIHNNTVRVILLPEESIGGVSPYPIPNHFG